MKSLHIVRVFNLKEIIMKSILNKLFNMETPTVLSNYITWLYSQNVIVKILLWPLNLIIGFFLILSLTVVIVHLMYTFKSKRELDAEEFISARDKAMFHGLLHDDEEDDEWLSTENWYDELTPKEQDDFNNYGELPF